MHHRATECPTEYPRKLVRTTVSNDYAPAFTPDVPATGGSNGALYDLAKDRINAVVEDQAQLASGAHSEL